MQGFLLTLKNHFLSDENVVDDTPEMEDVPKQTFPIFHSVFHLPITYLEESKKHTLSSSVSSDLELVISQSETKPMYDILFKPNHQFASEMIPYWSNQYASDIGYLEDTKNVLKTIPKYKETIGNIGNTTVNTEKLIEIWKSTKEDEDFMNRYSYIDWNMLKYVNESSSFLQIISMAQILSPIFSLLLPFLFLLIPFFLLKIKGADISIGNYLDMIQTIAKGHFIGTLIKQFRGGPINAESLLYVFFFGAFYGFQIYQNIKSCLRFHLIITRINDHLFELKKYVENSMKKMECFSRLHYDKKSYNTFCNVTHTHCNVLQELYDELHGITAFSYSHTTAMNIGYIMKCYYRVYSVEEYGNSLRYSFGFEGYIDNLFGVWENLSCGNISYSDYVEKNTTSKKQFTKITEQYYPPHLGDTVVTNTCKFNKNMIISAPNAAGKTTLLKSTAINIIFSQQLGCGFYKSCSLLPYTHIHSYLNIPDTSGRDSLFQAESRRCKEIIDMVSSPENKDARHFAILDELYSGTNPTEAGKSAYAFLKYLSKYNNIDFMLTTHYVYVCKKFKKSQKICNFKMGVNNVTENGYSFTYRLEPGISKIQGAMKILQDMDYPQEMLDVIKGM